jgi:hypothetical protein
MSSSTLLKRHVALPQDHGSWVFLLSPLLIGLLAGSQWNTSAGWVVLAAIAAFLIRQPITIAVKVYSGRRPRRDLTAAWFWTALYGAIGLVSLAGMLVTGQSYLLILALPGIPVFAWHLHLVSQRAERRQLGIEVVASGVLALAAPAAYWSGQGETGVTGWLLWALTWFQSAASIVYAYLRLNQRTWQTVPELQTRLKKGWRSLLYTSFNLLAVACLSIMGAVPPLLPLPYGLQWLEAVRGTLIPAIDQRPTAIGVRQLVISTIFTILFIVTWRVNL